MTDDRKPFRFHREARNDLRAGTLWYEERRDGLGARFAADVRRAIEVIVHAPHRWPVRRGTHRYVLKRFPYTIAYRENDDEVVIIAVAHHRLDPGSWEGR